MIPVQQDTEPAEAEHLLAVSGLRYTDGRGWLLLAVNEDLDRPRTTSTRRGISSPAPRLHPQFSGMPVQWIL